MLCVPVSFPECHLAVLCLMMSHTATPLLGFSKLSARYAPVTVDTPQRQPNPSFTAPFLYPDPSNFRIMETCSRTTPVTAIP